MECLDTVFLNTENKYKQLQYSIQLLHVQQAVINTLLEARGVMDEIYILSGYLSDYRARKGIDTRRRLIRKCKKYEPSESLGKLHRRSVMEPRIFNIILEGTEYSEEDFERISRPWLQQAAVCTILARECAFIRSNGTSTSFQNSDNQRFYRQLEQIRDAYLQARSNMEAAVVPFIIRRELNLVPSDNLNAVSI